MSNLNMGSTKPSEGELEWIKFKEETLPELERMKAEDAATLLPAARFMDKFKQNPFVPIGAGATVMALVMGIYNFKRGDQKRSQLMMRARVAAQAFTVLAALAGVALGISTVKKGDKSRQ